MLRAGRGGWTDRLSFRIAALPGCRPGVSAGAARIGGYVTKYGRSPWIDRVKKSRVPSYPHYRGTSTADVVVIGGGLTGCATAYAFSAAAMKVVVLEADQIGRGTTAASAGWVGDEP